jgi:hypothetical protein
VKYKNVYIICVYSKTITTNRVQFKVCTTMPPYIFILLTTVLTQELHLINIQYRLTHYKFDN